jgi:hypothetical protein
LYFFVVNYTRWIVQRWIVLAVNYAKQFDIYRFSHCSRSIDKSPSTWFYRKNWLSYDRKYKLKIEETRKVCAAINSFETLFSKNVVCSYFLFFYVSKYAKTKLKSENRLNWEIPIIVCFDVDYTIYEMGTVRSKIFQKIILS